LDPHLNQLHQEITSVVAGLSAEQMNWHPSGKWCAAEVLEHLYLTYTGTVKGFERATQAGKPLATSATWKQRGRTLVVVGFGFFPTGRKSPAVATPRGLPTEKVLDEIGPMIIRMDDIIRECEGKFGARTKLLDHPILGPLTASEWRKFHLVHGLHHGKQIRRLRKGAG
jgi:hypothetical protein